MIDQLILKLITPFAQCNQEQDCDAKTVVRANIETFDDEQKINYAHNLCHMYGALSLLLKIVAVAFIIEIVFFSFLMRFR